MILSQAKKKKKKKKIDKCEIIVVHDDYLLVKLNQSDKFKAIISIVHYSDIILTDLNQTFSVEKLVKCRVTNVNYKSQKISCTLKKSLLQSKLPIITDYSQLKSNSILDCYISQIKDDIGIQVDFYQKVHGFVSYRDLIH